MTISTRVQRELLEGTPATTAAQKRRHRTLAKSKPVKVKAVSAPKNKGKAWTQQEHARFLAAIELYPTGPWRTIAAYVGTKNPRQTMTHAQKFRQKMERRKRGLRNCRRKRGRSGRSSSGPSSSSSRAKSSTATVSAPTRTTRPRRRAATKRRIVIESDSESELESELESESDSESELESENENQSDYVEEADNAPVTSDEASDGDSEMEVEPSVDATNTKPALSPLVPQGGDTSTSTSSPFSDAAPDSLLFPLLDLWTTSEAALDDALADMNGFYIGLSQECC